ncbi:glycogen/starch/alpha-glucan phosphorylase, partial [Methylobacterium sp. WL122]
MLKDAILAPAPGEDRSDAPERTTHATFREPAVWDKPAQPASGDAVADLREAIRGKLAYAIGKTPETARERDWFAATALALRDRIVDACQATDASVPNKRVYYLSLEFLIGRLLSDAMNNLGLVETTRAALQSLGVDLGTVEGAEP